MFQRLKLILVIFISLWLRDCFCEEEIVGCNGFVKGNLKQDLSKIEVRLYTKQGSLKDKAEISENGYYFMPLINLPHGEYQLKVSAPKGLSFSPDHHKINFDGKTDPCSKNQDINFITYFGITGKVNVFNQKIGAKGVSIKLISAEDENKILGEQETDANGVFSFSPVTTGSYKVLAEGNFHFAKSEIQVRVDTALLILPENTLLVSGFDVKGYIMSENQLTDQVGLLIYSLKDQETLNNCKADVPSVKQSQSSSFEADPICYSSTKRNGGYDFENLSPGRYLIVPHFVDTSIKFHIQPGSLEIEVGSDDFEISDNFEITGFDVSGRVLLSSTERKGIPNAVIKIGGIVVTKTDSNGEYKLVNVKSGSYNIQVKDETTNYQFRDSMVKISPAKSSIPDIFVSEFKVCGKVISDNSHKVLIKKNDIVVQEVDSDPKNGGSFCTYLAKEKYIVEIGNEDKANPIQFFPVQQTIDVKSVILNDIVFSQLRAKITGQVKCLPTEENKISLCKSMEVLLSALDAIGRQTSTIKTSLVDGKYEFNEISPGNYLVIPGNQDLCWERNQYKLQVKSAFEKVATFVQTGYNVSIIATHDETLASYNLKSNPEKTKITLAAGLNTFCVTKSGIYDIEFSGCHVYDEQVKTFNTQTKSPITVAATKHLNRIRILSETSQNYEIDVEYENGKKESIRMKSEAQKVDGYFGYSYDFYLKPSEKVKMFPKSEEMLFKPDTGELVGNTDCSDVAFNFISTKGLVLSGETEPKINEVLVTLSFPKNPELSEVSQKTDAAGKFKFGPIDPNLEFKLSAEKESYVFSEFDREKNLFSGHKLCEIVAIVKDDEGQPLNDVLLSLSAESFRKNLKTGDDGKIKFHSLSPNKFYLKAVKKEYKFEPSSKVIDVNNGQTVEVELVGKRVAFSVMGHVQTLNGEPFGDIALEAVSTTDACLELQEEAVTESNGNYRIRGLLPGCDFKVRIKQGTMENVNVDRTIPKERFVQLEAKDVTDVNFIAINPVNVCDPIAKIRAKNYEHYRTLKIQLYKKGSDTPLYSQRVENLMMPKSKLNSDVMVFFPRLPLDHRTYYIELSTTLNEKSYKYELQNVQFQANSASFYAEFDFNPVLKHADELNQNSLAALILIFLVGFVFFKQELVFEMLILAWNKFNNKLQESVAKPAKKAESKSDNFVNLNEINKLATEINSIKKTKKPRKAN